MKWLGLVLAGLVVLGGWYFLFGRADREPMTSLLEADQTEPTFQAEAVDFEASFIIFTNGTLRTFSASMYHQLSDDVYLTAANPNLVQVKKPDVTWADFFATLPLKLTKDCLTTGTGQTFCTNSQQTLKFYLNNEFDPHLLEKVIQPGDQLLISYGDETPAEIADQLQLVPHAR
jgi:hypothetical protein